MEMAENTVWSLMAGGLLSLALLAGADALITRSLGAVRNVVLVSFIGSVCVLMSGLPEQLFPDLPERLLMVLKASLGPLAGALGLRFLGIWIGGDREDRLLYAVTVWGCYLMLIASAALAVLAVIIPAQDFRSLLLITASVNGVTVLLILLISVRATLMGDPLTRWLVLASLLLAGMMTGLYLHALKVQLGLVWWLLTASAALLFVLIVMVLIIVRNRANRELARLAQLDSGSDPVTGLPTGARLLSEVEHAFWRAGRLRGQCVVVCVYLSNLYELGDSMGRTTDNQILAATAARIRRAAGFRCVVGVYHPRCFMIVFTMDRKRTFEEAALARIRSLVTQPLQVVGTREQRQQFQPVVGMSVLPVLPDLVQPLDVLNEAEHQAMDEVRRASPSQYDGDTVPDDHLDTTW
ncbi:MAG: GGDEF domain-containing protein [Burkholderiaceae bacterium]|nr:GGDEF domain-containing protein [Burkholderiaceae bacterium]